MKKCLLFLLVAIMIVSSVGCGPTRYKNEDFITEGDVSAITYETKDKNVTWGNFQKNKTDITGNAVELHAEYIVAETEEEFVERVQLLKKKLDAFEVAYAFGYCHENGHSVEICIDADKIGLPVLALWNVNSSYDKKIVSSLSDFKAPTVEKMSYKLDSDKKYLITVDVPESYQKDFKEFCENNAGEVLYLKLGDITFSSSEITENVDETKVVFKGLEFSGNDFDESKYEMVVKLAEFVINSKDTSSGTSFALSVEEDVEYGIPFVTEFDKQIIGVIKGKYPNVTVTRKSVENKLYIDFTDSEESTLVTEDYVNMVEDIFKLCNFDDGAYSELSFRWSSKLKDLGTDNIYFSKYNGKMNCYPSERIQSYVEANDFLNQHTKK